MANIFNIFNNKRGLRGIKSTQKRKLIDILIANIIAICLIIHFKKNYAPWVGHNCRWGWETIEVQSKVKTFVNKPN